MVKVSGRTRDPGHLRAHLDYVARHGELGLEDHDGAVLDGRAPLRELAEDWSALALADRRRRATTPLSHSLVLSMPGGAAPLAVRDAARAFAAEVFADRFDYVLVLHSDTTHPHVHLVVRSLGHRGERLAPKKADLEAWRQVFAQALRDRGIEAEATPRRARGVTRKAERTPLRRIRERHEAGLGRPPQVWRGAYQAAARAAFGGENQPVPWEDRLAARQRQVRGLYLAQANLLQRSAGPRDRELGAQVETFVRGLPPPDTQRLALARELRAASRALHQDRGDARKDRSRQR
ncbi:relaxase/mobilization nuclease domain-containing protein [Phenylobacterium sp.]|uniref:relaxase/mobilization nuclease domain-containing protein n=1 Tax=Phenylobacterium sp. TaxID=1871053 RepID=UPI0025E5EBD4|nr:relaxase/mobilization nuclease domain-containing protein [Phenylobacterium sp.]